MHMSPMSEAMKSNLAPAFAADVRTRMEQLA
jgi:hypothetical protein